MEDRTTEQLAQDFTAMGHSVALINAIIAGDSMADDSAEDRQDCVDRNTQHLELSFQRCFWSSQAVHWKRQGLARLFRQIGDGQC
jgi:hypothetical protein